MTLPWWLPPRALPGVREQSGLGVTDVARRLGWQASRLSRLENRQTLS